MEQEVGPVDVAFGGGVEEFVEPLEQAGNRATAATFRAWLEQQRGERRAERERVEGRDKDRDRDGDGELLIEAAGDAGNGGGGDEDGGGNESKGDDRAGDPL